MNWHEIVGANIRRLRRAQGETQAELAEAAGIDVRGLGSIERGEGNPSLQPLLELAEALAVRPRGVVQAIFHLGSPTPCDGAEPRELHNARVRLEASRTVE